MTNAVIIAQQGANNTTFRNRIINGAMGIWQRGTSSTSAGYQTVDRWYENASNTTTFAQETSNLPSGFQYALKLTAGATAQMWIQQPIETKNCYDLQGQSVTLSVYLAASVSTSVTLYLYYSTSTDNPAAGSWTAVSSSTVTATSSYARYTATFTVPSNALTIMPQIITTSTVSSGTIVYITGVQLEAGTTASPFEYRSYGVELQLCQRYYQKSYNQSSAPGAATPIGMISLIVNGTGGTNYCQFTFPVPMRTAATISIWDGVGNSGKCSKYQAGAWTNNLGTIAAANIGESGYSISFDGTPFTTGIPHGTHYAASAEL
jgi:hypothetical protein